MTSKGRSGFTLIEVVLVMILVVVAAGIIAPAFSNFLPGQRLAKSGDEFMATLNKARSDAAITARRFRISIKKTPDHPEAGEAPYYYLAYEPEPMGEPGTFIAVPGNWGFHTELPAGIAFDSLDGAQSDSETREDYIEFAQDGTATDAKVVFSRQSGETLTIQVNPADGTAKIVDETKP